MYMYVCNKGKNNTYNSMCIHLVLLTLLGLNAANASHVCV